MTITIKICPGFIKIYLQTSKFALLRRSIYTPYKFGRTIINNYNYRNLPKSYDT